MGEPAPTFGEERIAFSDPSGLAMELIAGDRDARTPWTGGDVTADAAIRGLHGVTLLLHRPDATVKLMTELLGFERVSETTGRIRLAVNGNEPGKLIDIVYGTGARAAMNGLGTVHHVAMAIDGAEEQLALRERLIDYGLKVTEVLDRQYFQSIYFREPGGVLFEVATMQPGFTGRRAARDARSRAQASAVGGAESGRNRARSSPDRGIRIGHLSTLPR